MANIFVTLLFLGCIFYATAHHKSDQYNLRSSKNREQEQCIPEQVLEDHLSKWCKNKPEYDPEVLKNMYTEDATFQYVDQPIMKVQENIQMMAAFMKEFNTYYNLTKCTDFVGKYEVLGCEHHSIPAVVNGTITVKGKDKKHALNGPYSMEFKYVNGEIKMRYFVTKAAIDPMVFKQIWEKVVKLLPVTTSPEDLDLTTVSYEDDEEMVTETDSKIYNGKKTGKEQCIPEKDIQAEVANHCSHIHQHDPEFIKEIFTKDATIQYLNHPAIKVHENLNLISGLKTEMDSYFQINSCDDYYGKQEVLGCEHNAVPAIFKSTINVQGKDKKHSLKGSVMTEFKYEDGKIKVSKSMCNAVMDPTVFKQIWDKVQKQLPVDQEISTASPSDYQGEEYEQ